MVEELDEMTRVLAEADPEEKARLYAKLGLMLTYSPAGETVDVEAKPRVGVWTCRRGDLRLDPTRAAQAVRVGRRLTEDQSGLPTASPHDTVRLIRGSDAKLLCRTESR